MRFFRNPAFSTGTGGMILVFVAMYGVMFLITQYFQLVLGYSPLVGRAALAADGADHDRRVAADAAADARGSARTASVAVRHAAASPSGCCCSRGSRRTRRTAYVVVCVIPLVERASRCRCRR